MPTYDYECEGQGRHRFERFQRFSDPPVQECPECGLPVRRVIYPVGVLFKGPGFYKTDNAPKAATATEDGAKDGDAKGDGAEKPAGAAKPAAESKAGATGEAKAGAAPSSDS